MANCSVRCKKEFDGGDDGVDDEGCNRADDGGCVASRCFRRSSPCYMVYSRQSASLLFGRWLFLPMMVALLRRQRVFGWLFVSGILIFSHAFLARSEF